MLRPNEPAPSAASKWNITNSAQNIVSALVDPTKQDHAFRREWSNTFARSNSHAARTAKCSSITPKDVEKLVKKLAIYQSKFDERKQAHAHQNELERCLHGGDSGTQAQRSSRAQSRGLHQVPALFKQETFDLSDVRTFNAVLSIYDSSSNTDGHAEQTQSADKSNSKQIGGATINNSRTTIQLNETHLRRIQRDITDYLDIIEETLAGQISNRSGDFFQVMSSVDSVMDQMSLAIKSVTNLRQQCASLNGALIRPHMRNIQLTRSRSNAQKILKVLDNMANLGRVQSEIQLALSSSDFVSALELIAKTRRALATDLVAVVCLRHLEVRLNEIERLIGTLMQQRLTRMISERSRTKKA